MNSLFDYMKQCTRFMREQRQEYLNPNDLISYINRARREIAMRTQCIRVLTPSAGSIIGYSITAAGSGYTNSPTLTVSAPDFPNGMLPYPNGSQATASCIVQGGAITGLFSQYGGNGYFQPSITITDTTGTGATATPIVGGVNLLNQGQEKYAFSDIDLSANPGCDSVYAVRGVSIIYSGYRYSLELMAWTRYQIYRAYPYQYQYTPAIFSQFGQGTDGSLFFYPLPSQALQAEYDCQCLPSDLLDDQSYEAIPLPWTDAVPYFAAHFAMAEIGNLNASRFYLDLYEKFALSYSQFARIGRASNPYGRA
ncbi:MAG: hypothetical protein KGL39_17250 [Patescibacteria group bacterium]|nr:hypothetical protein [Patescibacteria group bacterium]